MVSNDNWRKVIYWTVKVIALVFYIMVISEGLRNTIEKAAIPLSEFPFPGFSLLKYSREWRKLDTAHLLAVLFYIASVWSWKMAILGLFFGAPCQGFRRFVLAIGFVIWAVDAILFVYGVIGLRWMENLTIATQVWVAAVGYAAVILFTAAHSAAYEKEEEL